MLTRLQVRVQWRGESELTLAQHLGAFIRVCCPIRYPASKVFFSTLKSSVFHVLDVQGKRNVPRPLS